jgi:hypothetical protein
LFVKGFPQITQILAQISQNFHAMAQWRGDATKNTEFDGPIQNF